MHPASLVLRSGKDLVERLPEAECTVANGDFRGDLQSPSFHIDQQFAPALRAFPNANLETDEFFLPSGVAPISTSMHSLWSSMRACRNTPSAHTYRYRRADKSRFCQCPYSPCHSAVSREITAGDRFGASLPNSAAKASWKSPVEMPRR